MITNNIQLQADSYKTGHWKMLLPGTDNVYEYFEAREGAEYPKTVFFGLQAMLMRLQGTYKIDPWFSADAEHVVSQHMGPGFYNREGWNYIEQEFAGKLPLEIWAVPEGSVHDAGDVLFTVVNRGGEKTAFLPGYLETLLVQVWYATTVATRSRAVKETIAKYLIQTTGSTEGIDFMLHDFGCRGAVNMEAAALGGLAHLINFKGTDTMPALIAGRELYQADLTNLGFSVAAAEHSIMTQLGRDGESAVLEYLFEQFPTGILAAPIDSYDYVNYVENIAGKEHFDTIMNRDGKFVFRPDSTSSIHPTPELEMVWLANRLFDIFGGTVNDLGFKVLDPHVGMLWGDGITHEGIRNILQALEDNGFAASNAVFGMGAGLLQKLNRDTQRFAYKCSAQFRNGEWLDIQKNPLDSSKASKAGRFDPEEHGLELVFDCGTLKRYQKFDDVRNRAALEVA